MHCHVGTGLFSVLLIAASVTALREQPRGFESLRSAHVGLTDIFTQEEIDHCYEIRIPALVVTPERSLVFGQCRHNPGHQLGAEQEDNKTHDVEEGHDATAASADHHHHLLRDNKIATTLVMKVQDTNTTEWHSFRIMTPPGNASQGVVYDAARQRVILQYCSSPTDDSHKDLTYWQQHSDDGGRSWSTPRDVSHFISPVCSQEAPRKMAMISAGNKLVTSTGRLMMASWGGTGGQCCWSSDDGGNSWNASIIGKGNEISLAEGDSPQDIVANSRGGPYSPHRSVRLSKDEGNHWGSWGPSPLIGEPSHVHRGCEASLLHVLGVGYFFSNPTKEHRKNLKVRFNPNHWNASTWHDISGPLPSGGNHKDKADACGYSYLQQLNHTHLILVMEVYNGVHGCTFASLPLPLPSP